MSKPGAPPDDKLKDLSEYDACADCGSEQVEDTWVTVDELEGTTEEEPLCARCSAKRELIVFGPDLIEWKH